MKREVNGGVFNGPDGLIMNIRSKCHWYRHLFLLFSVPSLTFSGTFSDGNAAVAAFPPLAVSQHSAAVAQMDNGIWDKMLLASWHSHFILGLMISLVMWMLGWPQLLRLISKRVLIIRVNLSTVRWGESGLTMGESTRFRDGFCHVLRSLRKVADMLNGFFSKSSFSWCLSQIYD